MIERILGKQQAYDIMCAAIVSETMPEKQASAFVDGLEKEAFSPLKFIKGLFNVGAWPILATAKSIPHLVVAGAGSGALIGAAYNSLSNRVQEEDPEERTNNKLEAMYEMKARELEDAKWMTRVRALRDELKRGKLSNEDYEAKFNELVGALAEKE